MKKKIQTEFESFYWQLLQHTKHLSQQQQDQLESKIRRTVWQYLIVRVTLRNPVKSLKQDIYKN